MLLPEITEFALLVVSAAEKAPEPEDVKAGWTAFAMFIGLIVVVGLLGLSLSRHLRKAQANEQAGLFGHDEPRESRDSKQPTP